MNEVLKEPGLIRLDFSPERLFTVKNNYDHFIHCIKYIFIFVLIHNLLALLIGYLSSGYWWLKKV